MQPPVTHTCLKVNNRRREHRQDSSRKGTTVSWEKHEKKDKRSLVRQSLPLHASIAAFSQVKRSCLLNFRPWAAPPNLLSTGDTVPRTGKGKGLELSLREPFCYSQLSTTSSSSTTVRCLVRQDSYLSHISRAKRFVKPPMCSAPCTNGALVRRTAHPNPTARRWPLAAPCHFAGHLALGRISSSAVFRALLISETSSARKSTSIPWRNFHSGQTHHHPSAVVAMGDHVAPGWNAMHELHDVDVAAACRRGCW